MAPELKAKTTAARVLNAHAAVSVVLIVVAAILYAFHSLDLSTTLGLIGIAITLVGGNATAILAAGKLNERRAVAGEKVVAAQHDQRELPAGHSVTVESRTTIAPEHAGEPGSGSPPATPAPEAPPPADAG